MFIQEKNSFFHVLIEVGCVSASSYTRSLQDCRNKAICLCHSRDMLRLGDILQQAVSKPDFSPEVTNSIFHGCEHTSSLL